MRWRIIFGFLATLTGLQSAEAKVITLTEISKQAIEHAPSIQAQAKILSAEEFHRQAAGLLDNPVLQIEGGQLRSVGTQGMTFEARLQQILPFFGKRTLRNNLAQIQVELQKTALKETQLLIQHQSVITAAKIAVLSEIAKHSLERQKRFKLIRTYLGSRPRISPILKIEDSLIESRIRLMEHSILGVEQALRSAHSRLIFLTGSPETLEPQMVWISQTAPLEKNNFLNQLDHSLLLQKKQWEIQGAEQVYQQARRASYPDFGLGLMYRNEAVLPSNQFFAASLSMSLPVFNRGQYSAPAALAYKEAEELKRRDLELKIRQDFEELWSELETLKKGLRQFPLALVQTMEKNFNTAELEFKKGRIPVSTFLETDTQIHETLDLVFETQLDYIEKLSQIHLMIGSTLQWF